MTISKNKLLFNYIHFLFISIIFVIYLISEIFNRSRVTPGYLGYMVYGIIIAISFIINNIKYKQNKLFMVVVNMALVLSIIFWIIYSAHNWTFINNYEYYIILEKYTSVFIDLYVIYLISICIYYLIYLIIRKEIRNTIWFIMFAMTLTVLEAIIKDYDNINWYWIIIFALKIYEIVKSNHLGTNA